MLAIQGLNQFYGASHTLWDITMEIPKGLCTCLLGRNGVGKTTLLKCIMGLLETNSGEIKFKSELLLSNFPEQRAHLGIGYVPQGREIFPLLTVEENLLIGFAAKRQKEKTIPAFIYDIFPVLKKMLGRRGGDLSGGQQQQLAIGRALMIEPEILILDEPAEGIQPNIVQEIGEIIHRLNREKGITVLLVEQKLPFVRKFADQFYIMEKGRLQAKGNIHELSEGLIKNYLTV